MRSRQQRLQERINEEPAPGIKLAARSVRIGPNGKRIEGPSDGTVLHSGSKNVAPSNTNDESKEDSTTTIPVMGAVVERRKPNRRRSRPVEMVSDENSKLTNPSIESEPQVQSRTGFPSIQAQPLGTFIMTKSNVAANNNTLSTIIQPQSISSTNTMDTSATALFDQMSTQEIQESIQELHSKLSPEMIQFLKQRSSRSNNSPQKLSPPPTRLPTPSIHTSDDSKRKMAQILSSIQSYDDLDAAYNQYVVPSERQQPESISTAVTTINAKFNNSHLDTHTVHEIVNNCSDDYTNNRQIDQDAQFHLACQLLRSTSSQQTLWASRIVCHRLQYEIQKQVSEDAVRGPLYTYNLQPNLGMNFKKDPIDHWPFPILLPVALRCLLDLPYHYGNTISLLQTTYVLQSIYALLQLRACPDHVVHYFTNDRIRSKGKSDVDTTTTAAACRSLIYQIDCLSDVIPTVPIRSCYAAATVQPINTDDLTTTMGVQNVNTLQQQATYVWASDSSPKSAEMDGQAFVRDPMWTLLSKMRIIPRLAQILQQNNCHSPKIEKNDGDDCVNHSLPFEARQSICGILAMIGQRSPGAATAIVHHPTLLQDLSSPTFLNQHSIGLDIKAQLRQHHYDPKTIIPVLHLLCTLSRQSRATAEGVYERISTAADNCPSGLLLHILLLHGNNICESTSKRNNEEYDKTKATTKNFDIQQWAIILWRTLLRYGFGLELLPTMITLSSAPLTLGFHDSSSRLASLAPEWYTCYAVILHGITASTTIDENVLSILSSPTLQRQSIYHLEEIAKETSMIDSNCEVERLTTSILMYWNALLSPSGQATDSHMTCHFENNPKLLLSVLNTILNTSRLKIPLMTALSYIFNPDFNDMLVASSTTSSKQEVQSIAFLTALLDLASKLRQHPLEYKASTDLLSELNDFEQKLEKKIIDQLDEQTPKNDVVADQTPTLSPFVGSVHSHCFNRVQALIISFLCRENAPYHIDRARSMAYTIIGRLNSGEECTALMLFGIHVLFHPTKACKNVSEASPVSALLLQELLRTSRKQLDHSCKLNYISRETAQGCFDVQSLLTDMGVNSVPSSGSSDDILPVGKYWLWKLLAGDTASHQLSKAQQIAENGSLDVLSTTLLLIDEMEAYHSTNSSLFGQLNDCAKLYFLTNICLKGEQVFSNKQLVLLGDKIFSLYFYGDQWGDILALANECLSHLDPKLSANSNTHDINSTSETEAVKAILDPVDINSWGWSKAQIRSIETYIGDLYDSYMDFGAQYEFFTKSIRLFLVKEFPTKIRMNLLNRFRSTLHLLSIQDDEKNMFPLLSRFLLGGMPTFDQSARDDPELIDGIASLYVKGSVFRSDDKFVKLWAICIVARSFAISISTRNKSGLAVSKRRLCTLDIGFTARIVSSVHLWFKGEGSLYSLIDASIQSEIRSVPYEVDITNLTDAEWEEFVMKLNSKTDKINQTKDIKEIKT